MSKKKGSANIIQGVYTSAKKLLTGGAGYGFVARSETFCEIEKFENDLVGYSLDEKLREKLSPENGERFILKHFNYKNEKYLSFTRVSESISSANLGRSTVIAHHLVIKAVDLKNAKMDASDLVSWAGGLLEYDPKFDFVKGWDKDPEELGPAIFYRKGDKPLTPEKLLNEMGFEDNQKKNLKDALLWVANRLFDLEETKKTAILIIPYDWQIHVPRLLAIILRLLPNGIQNSLVAASQVWDTDGLNFDASLIFTHPDAPYFETAKLSHIKNKVEILDLTNLASVSGTVSAEATDEKYKAYAVKEIWDKSGVNSFDLLWFFEKFDLGCLRKNDILALKSLHNDFCHSEFVNLEKLKNIIEKLNVFCDEQYRGYRQNLLKKYVEKAVEKAEKDPDNKNKCNSLLKIWKHVELIDLKSNERQDVLKATLKAISEYYEDILIYAFPVLANACIDENRNLEIIEIVKKQKGTLDSLLEAIENAVLNKTSNIKKYLPGVASNWFCSLGTRIIMSAWDRIIGSDRKNDCPCGFSEAIIEMLIKKEEPKLIIGSVKATGENNKQDLLKSSESKVQFKIKDLDPNGFRNTELQALKRAHQGLKEKIPDGLKRFIAKLKVFENDNCLDEIRKSILKSGLDIAVKQVVEKKEKKERCEGLFEIWDLVEQIKLEPNERDDSFKMTLKAISDNYEDILKYSSSAFAKACINVNRNREIVEIIKDKETNLSELLNAIEIEVLNSRRVFENTTKKNETSNIEKDLLDVASNWFILELRIIKPAWCRIMKVGGENDNPCYFSKRIVDLLVQKYCCSQVECIDDEEQP